MVCQIKSAGLGDRLITRGLGEEVSRMIEIFLTCLSGWMVMLFIRIQNIGRKWNRFGGELVEFTR